MVCGVRSVKDETTWAGDFCSALPPVGAVRPAPRASDVRSKALRPGGVVPASN